MDQNEQSQNDEKMLRVTTAVKRDTTRTEVVLVNVGVPDREDGEPEMAFLDPVAAEVNACGLLDALVGDDSGTVAVGLPWGLRSVSVKDAKWLIATLFRASFSAAIENNFADFMEGEVGVTPAECLPMLIAFREFNAVRAEDQYEHYDRH